MMLFDERHAFGGRDDADHVDGPRARPLDQVDGRHRAAAGRQHRVDHQDVAVAEV
jgi:hypothetical protein